jgi:subtilisin family serine protease
VAWYERAEQPKARSEAVIIVEAFAARGISIGGALTEDGWIEYMYAEGQLLVREQHLEALQEAVGNRAELAVDRRVVRDILLLGVNFPGESRESAGDGASADDSAREEAAQEEDRRGEADGLRLIRLLDEIDALLGPGLATLNHVVTTSPGGSPHGCPATEPQEVYSPVPYPPLCPGDAGDGVRIWVADTGLVEDTVAGCEWLSGVTGDPDPSIDANGTILPYGGHGTFVAGVIRAMAPGADIVVKCVFDIAGSALESDFVPKLYQGFGFGAEIVHITVASQTRHNLPLIAFETWLRDLRSHKGVACVVPAGNSASRHPSWPAAFPGVVSVGALATDWRSRAYFSNYGGWVDVYAPGENLVNAFATGTFTCQVAPFAGQVRTFTGMAQWSGTSFSTPIVTGLIAARMTRRGESAQEAAEALLARARSQAIPGVGPVLLPECEGDCDCGHQHGGCGDRHGGCGHQCGCEPVTRTKCGCHGR